ncbi:hypothetical protein, partial [Propionibacterium freudenreichii]|uniref:hypothetical protein n=1 Tax=Propionibacterium freudenreichii TaxID=1744 RepID=UPI0021A7390A
NDNPTRAIRTLHRSDPRRPGVLLRRYDTTVKFAVFIEEALRVVELLFFLELFFYFIYLLVDV